MPTPFEQELLVLAARQREANNASTGERELPSLDGLFGAPSPPVAAAPSEIAPMSEEAAWRTLLAEHRSAVAAVERGEELPQGWQPVQAQAAPQNVPMEVLEGLWDTSEAQEPGELTVESALAGEASVEQLQNLWGVPGGVPAYEDFDLGGGQDLPGTGAPNPRARFQMGRQEPPIRPFRREMTPMDAEVVSQRDSSGHFHAVERPRTAVHRDRPPSARVPQGGPRQPAGAPQAASRAMAVMATVEVAPAVVPTRPSGVPSRYQRLLQPSSIDIDEG